MKTHKWMVLITILILMLSACTTQPTQVVEETAEDTTVEEAIEEPEVVEPTDEPVVEEPTDEPVAEEPEAEEAEAEEVLESEAEVLTFTDDLDRTIELEGTPQAILSLSPSATETLFAIGAGDQVIGRDDNSFYPDEATALPSIGSLWGGLPIEPILALEPDLVICAQIILEEQVTELEELGLTVYWMANPDDFEGLYANTLRLAEITGHEEEAASLNDALSARVAAVEDTIASVEEGPSVFYELDATDPSNPWTTGAGTFIDYVMNMVKASNAAASLQGDYAQISSEELIAVNPDVILLSDAMYGVTPESVGKRAGWETIKAVEDGAVFPFDPFILSVPGPRLVDGLEVMASLLYPDLFE